MQVRNFRSLDQPSSFFGIKGRFIIIPIAGGLLGLFVGVIIGSILSGLVGILLFLFCVGAAYGATIILQERMGERDFQLLEDKVGLPRGIIVAPRPMRDYLDNKNPDQKNPNKK